MKDQISSVLLVHPPSSPVQILAHALRAQAAEIREARTCGEAAVLLAGPHPPEIVFTDKVLLDGTWADIVRLAQTASAPVNVIVVSRFVDIPVYVEALQSGAFDFIVPPFESSDLAHIVRCAAGNVAARREGLRRVPLKSLAGTGQLQFPAA